MNNTQQGRQDLLAWEASKPDNFFTSDRNLQQVLQHYLSSDYATAEARLSAFGAECATTINHAAQQEDRLGNHPRLERWSGLGERLEQIEFHPNHDVIGGIVWQHELMALQSQAGNTVLQMGLYYLLAHNGEGGHMCSLACTSGLIRALQQAADKDLQARFLPPLLNPDYEQMQHGAQFLTEVQGGSDVGANSVTASPQADGTWRITGEKWFCSNINAEQFLMTARASDAEGTRGLGLFLVPRQLEDGSTNGFYIRRLKDKLGTRTLASAELDFQDAIAYPIGAVERGFKTVVELVLNTSRLMNAVACAGVMRRAYLEAAHYACHRQAFGKSLISYPMVQEALADLLTESAAATASSFYLAHLLDKIETGQATETESAAYRFLVNVNKYITSITGSMMVHRAIEVLGGNGAIESFSILPRLYRDMVVLESWEGTHNVLCLQVLRDSTRYGIHQAFIADLKQHLSQVTQPSLEHWSAFCALALNRLESLFQQVQTQGDNYAQAHARRLVDWAAYSAQAVFLVYEAEQELRQQPTSLKADIAAYFIQRHLQTDYDAFADKDYLPRLERLMAAL